MSRLYLFADEAGDFSFRRGHNISRFFVVCTVSMHSCQVGDDLLQLRRKLAWEGAPLGDYFHATVEAQEVRDIVFEHITSYDFSIQATVMEKSKAQRQVRSSQARFYQYGWFYHFCHGMPGVLRSGSEILITAASIGTKKKQGAFRNAVNDVVQQTVRRTPWATTFCPCAADPCLQVADYCTWAIQRKWERDDDRSYALIADRITYEFDLWEHGTQHFY